MTYRFIAFFVALLLGVPMASADSLDVVQGDRAWHPFQTPSVTGTAYWNNGSYDPGGECNVGYWLSGTGGCQAVGGAFLAGSPRLTPPFLGDATTTFQLTKEPTTASVTVTNRVQVSAWEATNEVGWFDLTNPARLFPLLTPTVKTATFVPSATYGFYVTSPQGTYQSTGTGDTQTHFAVFQLTANARYIIGVEDLWTSPDRDFNDMIFDIEIDPVPEPATMVLLGSGLVGLAAAARRRRARRR